MMQHVLVKIHAYNNKLFKCNLHIYLLKLHLFHFDPFIRTQVTIIYGKHNMFESLYLITLSVKKAKLNKILLIQQVLVKNILF